MPRSTSKAPLVRVPRRRCRRWPAVVLGSALCLALAGCETAQKAMDSVADASTSLWSKVSSPFGNDSGTSASRDATRERREDVEQWERIRGSNNPTDFQNFIERYPDSALIHLARRRLATLQPTENAKVEARVVGVQPPPPPKATDLGIDGGPPAMAAAGQFPAPWVLGRWAIDCGDHSGGNGVTYLQLGKDKVRIVRDDGSSAVYTIRRENNVMVLDGNGLIYQDEIVSPTELHSYAVKYNGQWDKVDLIYRKCD